MRLAASEGRLTKWRQLYDELNPRDVVELEAFSHVEPWGDRRDDMRHAWMTSVILKALGWESDPALISKYLKDESDGDGSMSPNAIAATMRQQFPSRSR